MTHVPVLLWKCVVLCEKGWWFDLSTASVGLRVYCALGGEVSASKETRALVPGLCFLLREGPEC